MEKGEWILPCGLNRKVNKMWIIIVLIIIIVIYVLASAKNKDGSPAFKIGVSGIEITTLKDKNLLTVARLDEAIAHFQVIKDASLGTDQSHNAVIESCIFARKIIAEKPNEDHTFLLKFMREHNAPQETIELLNRKDQ